MRKIGRQQHEQRERERQAIVAALTRESLIERDLAGDGGTPAFDAGLSLAIQRYLARSAAVVMMVQIEDLLMEEEQVNVPGTVDEYPNWRIKLAANLEDWPSIIDLEAIARVINLEREDRISGAG